MEAVAGSARSPLFTRYLFITTSCLTTHALY